MRASCAAPAELAIRNALACVAVALTLACSQAPEASPDKPAGAALVADRAQLVALLSALAELDGTPLGRGANELLGRLPDCPGVEAEAAEADLSALLAALRCSEPEGLLAGFAASQGDHGIALAWPLGAELSLRGWLDVDAGGAVRAEFRLPAAAAQGPAALLVPAPEPPGPALLSGEGNLLHARLRPAAGLDLAALVPRGGQADQMFRLKSELFQGLVLDGTWEAALYLPGVGEPVPRAALALGFSHRAAAVTAVEGFLHELGETWPVQRSSFSHDGAAGACLLDLAILPGFAPCYVATRSAVVIGYNPASLRTALAKTPAALGGDGGLRVELARFQEADARLAPSSRPSRAGGAPPWERLHAEAHSDTETVRIRFQLDPGERILDAEVQPLEERVLDPLVKSRDPEART